MIPHMKPSSGAHVGAKATVSRIMWQVILAISPATVFGLLLFGWPALNLFIITVSSAVFFEAFCLRLSGRIATPVLMDGSAVLTGWLLAMTMPPWAPWWIGVVGSAIAIILGKQVYGGLGQNLFNPAMLARVALLISFPIEMTTWANVSPLFFSHSPGLVESWHITFAGLEDLDASTGATTLGYIKTEFSQNHLLSDILKDYSGFLNIIGWKRGSLGETSTLLLALGGVWLIRQGVIQWYIPLSLLLTVIVLASFFHVMDGQHYAGPFLYLNSGSMMCTAMSLS